MRKISLNTQSTASMKACRPSRFPLPTLERIDTAAHIGGGLQQPRRSRRCYGEGTACAAMARAPSTLVLVDSAGSPRNILYRRLAPPCGKVRPREPLPCYPLGRTDTTPISGHCQTRSPINNNAPPAAATLNTHQFLTPISISAASHGSRTSRVLMR